MNFISYADLYKDINDFAGIIPKVNMVIGVPRSGLMVASRLALLLQVPLAYFDFNSKKVIDVGGGARHRNVAGGKPLVIDDSIDTGASLNSVMEVLGANEIYYGAIYGSDRKYTRFHAPILIGKHVPNPRLFEWNFLNTKTVETACVDIDGVLCKDPKKYDVDSLRSHYVLAEPLHRSAYEIDTILTSRPESARLTTQRWLGRNSIRYKNLIMRSNMDMEPEVFKSLEYGKSPCTLFVESDDAIAKFVTKHTGKPVICTDTMKIYA